MTDKKVWTGQAAREKLGIEMSQAELTEFNQLREKARSGQKLSDVEENRFFLLEEKRKTISHTI